jgi:type II secretory pathway pseudopilin PulG
VVIGIIALLIGILLPALGRVQRQARQTQCMSNLRQLMSTAAVYQANNNGAFPYQRAWSGGTANEQFIHGFVTQPNPLRIPAGRNAPPTSWVLHLARLMVGPSGEKPATPGTAETIVSLTALKNVFECPINRRDSAGTSTFAPTADFSTSYVANGVLTSFPKLRRKSSAIIAFWDNGATNEDGSQCRPGWRVGGPPSVSAEGWSGWMYFGSPSTDPNPEKRLTARTHSGGICMAFADGRAEFRLAPDITAREVGLIYVDASGAQRKGRPNDASLGTVGRGFVVYEPRLDGYSATARQARVRGSGE